MSEAFRICSSCDNGKVVWLSPEEIYKQLGIDKKSLPPVVDSRE